MFDQFYFHWGAHGATCEKKIALSLKRHLFPHGNRVKMLAQGFLNLFFDAPPISTFSLKFLSSALKRHLLKRHVALSEDGNQSQNVHKLRWAKSLAIVIAESLATLTAVIVL